MQDTTSFWTEIKKYEDLLAREPDSYCYATLAELYRKLGLVNDAVGIAERGCRIHPEFVTGRLSLAMAYLDKEEKATARIHLQKVVSAVPENLQAQKLLSQLMVEAGDVRDAQSVLRTLLFFHPEEIASQAMLESLQRMIGEPVAAGEEIEAFAMEPVVEPDSGEALYSLEDADLFEVADDTGSGLESEDFLLQENVAEEEKPSREESRDPLTTGTLAELYVSQGFVDKAIGIYRELAQANPGDTAVLRRLRELESPLQPEIAEPAQESEALAKPESVAYLAETAPPGVPETELETLERWLTNITRRRACHSEAF